MDAHEQSIVDRLSKIEFDMGAIKADNETIKAHHDRLAKITNRLNQRFSIMDGSRDLIFIDNFKAELQASVEEFVKRIEKPEILKLIDNKDRYLKDCKTEIETLTDKLKTIHRSIEGLIEEIDPPCNCDY